MSTKTVYWSVSKVRDKRGYYVISYWTKPDQSNLLKLKLLSFEEDKLRAALEDELGIKHFNLKFEKES